MRVRAPQVHLLSDGTMKLDGGTMFGQVPRDQWGELTRPDKRNRIPLGLNVFLIRSDAGNILVDTGAGGKLDEAQVDRFGLKANRLRRSLRDVGLKPADIKYVVLTHLHFDHAGGATRRNRKGETVPTFPKARYLIQSDAWEHAAAPSERASAAFIEDDYLPLWENGQVDIVDGDQELIPGVWLKNTGGHSQGHQVVYVKNGSNKMAFLGDLVPTAYHLGLPYISATDQFPEETLERKRHILGRAEREGWLIFFAHGCDNRAGVLERRGERLTLRPVAV